MRILNVKESGVTQGVIGRDLDVVEKLIEVTFEDELGIPHTVFSNKNGPWTDAKAIVEAWGQHELHPNPTENPPPPDTTVQQSGNWS